MHIFLFTIPAKVYFHFTVYSVTFGHYRSQWAIQAGNALSVFHDIYIVDAAFTFYVNIDATAVATYHVSHECIIQAEVNLNFVTGRTTYMTVFQSIPNGIPSQ